LQKHLKIFVSRKLWSSFISFFSSSKYEFKYVLITGGNAGIGLETARELCRLGGYHVTITARNDEKANDAITSIKSTIPDAQIGYMTMELKELSSVRAMAEHYIASSLPLHILINNAGIMNTPFEMTKDGFEAQFQVNHLGHFLLTHYLLPILRETNEKDRKEMAVGDPCRVINVSSRAHMRWSGPLHLETVRTESASTYDGWGCYGRSKLANILFACKLAKKFPLEQSGITFNALHPGLVDTKLLDVAPGLSNSAIPLSEGIKCSLFAATSEEVKTVSGSYFHDSAIAKDPNVISKEAKSDELAEDLWKESLHFVGLTDEIYGMPQS
jgi:NAD(P)-dependent dehydrogenase (short-subunit alcohol dehydrogenase family)